jgi:hypothetical protein
MFHPGMTGLADFNYVPLNKEEKLTKQLTVLNDTVFPFLPLKRFTANANWTINQLSQSTRPTTRIEGCTWSVASYTREKTVKAIKQLF